MSSWNLTLLLFGVSILFLARDSYQNFFGSLLIITAGLGITLDELDLSIAVQGIGLLIYIILHLFAIALSPLQILLARAKPQPKVKTGIVIYHPETPSSVQNISVDVVAVHGLGSNPEWAWQHEASGVMWLKDLLPAKLPRARIMAFNHNSAWNIDAPVKSVEVCGQQLLDALNIYRDSPEEKERPIIFIGHSFGGIIIKKALVTAGQENMDPRYQYLKTATLGTIFLGAPHDGSRLTTIGMLFSYSTYWLGSSTELLEALKPGESSLRELNDSFLKGYRGRHIVNFFETLRSRAFGIPLLLGVEGDASRFPGTTNIALNSDHIGMNKFENERDHDFLLVVKEICSIEQSVHQERLKVINLEQQKCLDHLYLPGSEDRKDAIEKSHKSTFQWVDGNPVINGWIKNKSQVVWISGKPGSGKSTLAKYLVDDVIPRNSKTQQQGTTVTASFFFNGRGSEDEKSERGFLQALLHQIVTQVPELSSLVPESKVDNTGKMKLPSLNSLRKSLVSMLGDSRIRAIRLVIDAFDECGEDSKETLIEFVTEDLAKHPSNPQILLTSRPDIDLKHLLETYPTINMEDLNGDDIKSYLSIEFGSLASRDPRPKVIEGIVEKAISRSQGVFLWVKLVVKELKRTARFGTTQELGEALDALPENLVDFYDHILEGLDMSSNSEARRMFEWVLFAKTPLSAADFRYAISLGSESPPPDLNSMEDATVPIGLIEARIHKYSGGLLEVKIQARKSDQRDEMDDNDLSDSEVDGIDKNRFVQLIHQSVKDFLLQKSVPESKTATLPTPLFISSKAHTHLAEVCFRFLAFPDFDTTSALPTPPFLKYSTINCIKHAPLADTREERSQMAQFQWPRRKNFLRWSENLYLMDRWGAATNYRPDPLIMACHIGTFADAKYFLAIVEEEADAKNATFRDALVAASGNGNEKVVQLLLDAGTDVNSQDRFYGTALQAAAFRGHEKILQLLLDAGADVNQGGYATALQAAAAGGHEKVVQLLFDAGADVNQGGHGTPLQVAASGGHEKVAQLILDAGADVNSQGGFYGTALQAAALEGHEKILQLLLDAGADVNSQGGIHGNPLQAAASNGHEKVVQLLLDAGADVNSQGGFYGNAFQAAASEGYEKVVQLLLDAGADVNSQGESYGAPLQAAASEGHKKVVQLLLDGGADVNSQGGFYGTPLQAAAFRGHEKVVQLLLDAGADVNSQGDILQTVAFRDHKKVVQLLLDAGAGVDSQGRFYGNALQAAASKGHEKIVQLLLDGGADVNQGGKHGKPLQAAVFRGHEKVVQLLLDAGANAGAQDE